MLSPGQRVDRYLVEGKLGEGGMATVYRVRHETLGTAHALKTLAIVRSDLRERLLAEGRVQAQLQHEHVVQVTDVLTVQGFPSLLMEFVEGPSLETWLVRYQPTLDEALALFRGICLGVGYAHQHGVVHRDLKPANVLLAVQGSRLVPKVADFGLAKDLQRPKSGATRTGSTMGTPAYMAPEQIRDASSVDRRADLWSLGCILYRLVCGVPPFEGDDLIELFTQVGAGDHVPSRVLRPELPERVHQILERLLQVPVDQRLGDCGVLLAFLDGRIDRLPPGAASAGRPSTPETTGWSWLPQDSPGASLALQISRESLASLPKLSKSAVGPSPPSETLTPAPQGEQTRPEGSIERVTRSRARAVGLAMALGAAVVGALLLVALGAVGMVAIVQGDWARLARSPVGVAPAPEPGGEPGSDGPEAPEPIEAPAPADPVRPTDPTDPTDPTVLQPGGEDAGRPDGARPAPSPRPRRTPDPKVEAPAPAPPAPSPAGARVTFAGADALWLETIGEVRAEVRDLGSVPPGRYRIYASFPGLAKASGAGELRITGSERVHLSCVPEMAQCRAAPAP